MNKLEKMKNDIIEELDFLSNNENLSFQQRQLILKTILELMKRTNDKIKK